MVALPGRHDHGWQFQSEPIRRWLVDDRLVPEPVQANLRHGAVAEFVEFGGELAMAIMKSTQAESETSEDETLMEPL